MNVALLVVTYAKDLEFFRASANSYKKFATGFSHAKVVVPTGDVETFRPVAEPNGFLVEGFDEEPGKGFLSHLRMKCYADHHFPEADFIVHMDADCVFTRAASPFNFIQDGRAVLPYTPFSALLQAPSSPEEQGAFMGVSGSQLLLRQGRYFWKGVTEFALGLPTPWETMQQMPIVHHRLVYWHTRATIEQRFNCTFEQYLFSCRNEFPQTFCEFNALGEIARNYFPEKYWFIEGSDASRPVIQTWSHGGLDLAHDFGNGPETPRELFKRLDIL